MPRIAVIDRLADRHAERKKGRERKRALKAYEHRGRKAAALKAVACVLMVAVFALLAFLVGTDEYQVTLVGWVPLIMTLCGIGLGFAHMTALRRGIEFEEVLVVPECQRDSDVPFTVAFANKTPLLATRMTATFYIADMFDNVVNEVSTTLSLAPFESYDLSLSTRFEHIGTFHAGLAQVTIADYLGLFTHAIQNSSKQVVRVTPKILELDGIRFSNEAMDEATKAARSVLADSMDYAYVREYELGDPLKTIHWKLSARADTYMTRLYEVYTNPSVVIIMDFYADCDEAEDLMSMFDAVVESTFSLARYARSRGMDTEVHFRNKHGADQVAHSADQGKVSEIIADLPKMSNDPADAAGALDIIQKQIGAARGFNNIFVCTANVGADMVSAIVQAKVRRRSPHMIAVIPPSLVGRDRDRHSANLARLDSADIPFSVISHCSDLSYAVEGGA